MLNNKKSLLQRARIAMVAIVTIIGIGGAFAVTPPKLQGSVTYGVLSTTTNNYQVTSLGLHPSCAPSSNICEVRSTTPPDMSGNIPKIDVSSTVPGDFSK